MKPTFQSCSCKGMALVELMIVVSVLAILAAIVIPRFANSDEVARTASAATSMRAIGEVIKRYQIEHGGWPSDLNRGHKPPELEPYLPTLDFNRTPIGGKWDFENWTGRGRTTIGGTPIAVCISLVAGDTAYFQRIDELIDDGNLASGVVQQYQNNRLVYLIEIDS
ncbi:MAG: prepilin-type N-terminal cleavage/methylation domain-containing protein [Phycisphaeraceae bacterium]|nr:prepilin-type N-terminal cleavage/methylation domain-containing protein [Phycisphaeraceae bacterium]